MSAVRKILFAGCSGAGKTTAIGCVSTSPLVRTEVPNCDPSLGKRLTTVGLDYGEIRDPQSGEQVLLYGCPGQERFAFLWSILARGALGLVLLSDNQRPDPLEDVRCFLRAFAEPLRKGLCAVLGVVKTDLSTQPDVASYFRLLDEHGLALPVFEVDVRRREDVLLLLEALLCQIEARQLLSPEEERWP